MKRPFGQLNVKTNDLASIAHDDLKPTQVQVSFTSIPTTFNALTETAENPQAVTYTTDIEDINAGELTIDYILAAPEQAELADFSMTFLKADGSEITTNDNFLYGRIAEKAEPSVLDTDYATDLKEQHVAFIVNAEAILDMPLVKMATGFLSPEHRTYVSMAEHIAYIGLIGQLDTGKLVLELKDKDSNALKQLVDFIKTFIGI